MNNVFLPVAAAVAWLFVFATSAWPQPPTPEGIEFFEQKIRPVLVQHCYKCHSVQARDDKKLQGELYLDSAEGTLAGGESGHPALVKGKSADSLLIKALQYDGLEMPPAGKLPTEVVADFAKWIDMGAPDPRQGSRPASAKPQFNVDEGKKWWSFQPLREVVPPAVPEGSRVQTPIDRFIIAAQQEQKLTLAAPATKEKLLRRAYFDLIGLPPTPDQIEAFTSDHSAQAFAKVVDSLLESPHYGEKWARHWLDVARFAESGGYEFDGFRPGAYHYRDWVIQALNRDMPYDQFVRMQIAGDVLQPDDYHGLAASGFLVAGPFPGQITAKTVERIRYDQLDDMLMTVGGSMLGLTLGCVRCHDHKYDPLQQQDYYALAASLAKTSHGSRSIDPDPAANRRRIQQHAHEHEQRLAALRKFSSEELPQRFEAWRTAELARQPEAPRWQVLEPVVLEAERSWLKVLPGNIVAHDGAIAPGTMLQRKGERRAVAQEEVYRVTAYTHQANIASLRLDALTDQSLPKNGPGLNGDGSFQLVELKVIARPRDPNLKEAPLELKLKAVHAALSDKDQPLANALDGLPTTAWVVRETAKKDNAAVFELETPLAGFAGGTQLDFELKFRDVGLGRVRFSLCTQPNPSTWAGDQAPQHVGEMRAILATNNNQLPAPLLEAMAQWFAPFDSETANVFRAFRDYHLTLPRPELANVYTTIGGGQDVYLLRRGEVENKQGKAEPNFVQVLTRGDLYSAAASVDPRVSLANAMTSVEQGAGPLLARVIVNRLWQHHFGNGIVGTPNDFGAQGDRPTHPELLEWLAGQLIRGGWKLKPLHRQIMLSAVYQQSHEVSPDALKVDPANRYLWHYQPRRLDAELIRDALLATGESLDVTMYGPSILDNTPRRSVYLRVKRSELIPMMVMFDAPEPTQSVGERISTTVPTQSLAMMNSPLVRQQAERLAQRIRPADPRQLRGSIDHAYQIAFARQPSDAERRRMLDFLEQQRAALPNDVAVTDRALVEFCHVLLCLSEFVYID